MLPSVRPIQSDVSDPAAFAKLHRQVVAEFPNLNMLINNAGVMRKINLHSFGADLQDLTREINIDLNGAIHMTVEVPITLEEAEQSRHVWSGLAFVPPAISLLRCIPSRSRCIFN
jgi:uncharacterized oxidoreductase